MGCGETGVVGSAGQAVFTVAARGRNGRLAPAKLTVDGFELDVRYDAP